MASSLLGFVILILLPSPSLARLPPPPWPLAIDSKLCGSDRVAYEESAAGYRLFINERIVDDPLLICAALESYSASGCFAAIRRECSDPDTYGRRGLLELAAAPDQGNWTPEERRRHRGIEKKDFAVPGMLLLCCAVICPCFRSRRRSVGEHQALSKELSSMESVSSLDINSASERAPGTPLRIPPSPARVPPSPSRFSISPQLSRVGSIHLSVSQIYKATQNFSPSLRLGEGGFGTVYKAVLPDGQVVAVKRAKKEHLSTLRDEFSNEVELLSKIEHRSLVKLLGYTEKGNERIIITEHVPNGTLREHLDGQHGKILDFNQRLEIAIDVAHALTYLHLYAEKTIIHRDVKSSNILLTENYRAKVSDFGFAKGTSEADQTHIMTKVKGTAGYLDPEYLQTYQLTPKSDVFSFGILLIEILSGRRPVELKRAIEGLTLSSPATRANPNPHLSSLMAEGIALLSMYNDEEDEDDDPMDVAGTAHQSPNPDGTSAPPGPTPDRTPTPPLPSRTPPPFDGDYVHETLASPIPQSPPPSVQFTLPSGSPLPPAPPPSFPELFDALRPRTGALAALGIVDYAHDDTAMSPEPEEGEIVSTSHTVMETEIHISEEHFEERTPPGVGIQPDPPQPSGFPEYSAVETHMTMEFTRTEIEVVEFEEPVVDSVDVEKDDPLSKFLPPPATTKCPEELQERINKFLAYKKAGKSFNADLRNRKDYRNPDFLQHAVSYQDIDQIGTCFSKDVFDPHGYDKSDYYDELEADMKREIERKDQERKKSHKVDFVSGGTHSVTTAPMVKTSGQIPAVTAAAATSGLQLVSTASDTTASRHNRKTKWDKVDSDVKIPLQSGGQDDRPTVASHTSSSNAGSGYSAFAQQKRREAEEKKSSERKFEKRS